MDIITYPEGFGNEMPRKGTETEIMFSLYKSIIIFGNEMPRKGTETCSHFFFRFSFFSFGNEMPRKGTETEVEVYDEEDDTDLEMRCPGRGRKPA